MSPKINITSTITTHTVIAEIKDGEPLPHPWNKQLPWIPDRIALRYCKMDGNKWSIEDRAIEGEYVSGIGTHSPRVRTWFSSPSTTPPWVKDFIDNYELP